MRHLGLVGLGVALAAILLGVTKVYASEHFGAHLDVGFGVGRTEPFVTGGATCVTVGLAATTRLYGPARACLDFCATAGEDGGTRIPEAAMGGRQSLVTFLGGVELVDRESLRGPFMTAGLGVGHSTISGARGPTESPNFGFVPLHDRTAIAYGLGLGYRFSFGPGPFSTQLALRTHGLLRDDMTSSAYATLITLGFVY